MNNDPPVISEDHDDGCKNSQRRKTPPPVPPRKKRIPHLRPPPRLPLTPPDAQSTPATPLSDAQSTSTPSQPDAQSSPASPQPHAESRNPVSPHAQSTPAPPTPHGQSTPTSPSLHAQSTPTTSPPDAQSTRTPPPQHAQLTPSPPPPQVKSTAEEDPVKMEENLKELTKIFSCLPTVLIRRTLNVSGDIEIARQRLQQFQAIENPLDILQTSARGKGPTGTGQEKCSRGADFREKKKSERFVNHNEMAKEQGEMKELRHLITDSFDDYSLGQNNGCERNQGQNTRPSGVFRERPRGVPREGPSGGFAEGQSNNQGFRDNDKEGSQGWSVACENRVGRGYPPKPKTRGRGRGYRGRGSSFQTAGEGFQDADQLFYGDNLSQSSQGGGSQQHRGKRELSGGKRCQGNWGRPRDSSGRGRGQRGAKLAQNLSSVRESEDQPCQAGAIEQSRFQKNELFVSELSALATEDCLVNFTESSGEVEDVIQRDDKALITMGNDITGNDDGETPPPPLPPGLLEAQLTTITPPSDAESTSTSSQIHGQSTTASPQPCAQSSAASPQPRAKSTNPLELVSNAHVVVPTPHAQSTSASPPLHAQSTSTLTPPHGKSTPITLISDAQSTPTPPSRHDQLIPSPQPQQVQSTLASPLKHVQSTPALPQPHVQPTPTSNELHAQSTIISLATPEEDPEKVEEKFKKLEKRFNLGQNSGYESNQGQNARPSGIFSGKPRGWPRESPRGSFAQGQSNNQEFRENFKRGSQGWGVGCENPKQGAGVEATEEEVVSFQTAGEGFKDADQLFYGDNRSQFSQGRASHQHNGRRELSGGKAAQFPSSIFVNLNQARHSTCDDSPRGPLVGDYPEKGGQQNRDRNSGQRRTRPEHSFSSLTKKKDKPCQVVAIEQSRFQQNQLLVSGLSALTTEDCLVNFIEAMSGGEVENVRLRDDKALITMTSDITDFSRIKTKGEVRGLESAKVTIEQVPVSRSIIVSGISDNTTHDAIELYFESERYGGGSVERVEFLPKGGRAVVIFQDPKDIKGVLARQQEKPHVLNQAQLSIRIFHEFLESQEGDVLDDTDGQGRTAGGTDKAHSASSQQSAVSQQSEIKGQKLYIAVDSDVMEFVSTSASCDELSNSLATKNSEIIWKPNNKMAQIVYEGQDDSDSWKSECISEVQNYLDKFEKRDVQVNKEFWSAVVAQLSSIRACLGVDPPLVKPIYDSSAITMVSLSTDVKDNEEKLKSKLEEIYREETRKSYAEKDLNVPKERLILLKKIKFVEKLQKTNKELEIKLDTEGEEIYFKGPESQFTEATTKFVKQMSDMVEKNLTLSFITLKILGSDEGLKKVQSELEHNDVEAVFVIDKDSGARIVSTSAAHCDKAERLVNSLTVQQKVQVDDKSESLKTTQEWCDLCDKINFQTAVRIHSNIWNETYVAGFQDEVMEVMKMVNAFLESNSIRKEQFTCPSQIVRRYLAEFRREDLRFIETQLKYYEVKIEKGKGADEFDISGNRKSLTDVRRQLDTLVEDTESKTFDVKQPGLRSYFNNGKGDRLVRSVEKDQNCAIHVEKMFGISLNENDGDGHGHGDGGNSEGGVTAAADEDDDDDDDDDEDDSDDEDDDNDNDYDERAHDHGGASGNDDEGDEDEHAVSSTDPFTLIMTKGHHKISWRTGKIETEKADVLVSAVGATSQAIITAGVSQITTPNVGDITVSPGVPLANHVINTYPFQWNGGKGEESLRALVQKCLQKAEELRVRSIAFPVIGTGNLNFPRNAASRIMLEETISFCQASPASKVRDIRFVVFEQDQALTAAFKLEMDKLKSGRKFRSPVNTMSGLYKSIRYKFRRIRSDLSVSTASNLDSLSNGTDTGQPRKRERRQTHSASQEHYVRIFVLGKKNAGVEKAVESLKKGFSEACMTEKVENENVSQLSRKQIVGLRRKAEDHDVKLVVEADVDRIVVRGQPTGVSGMVGEIWKEINERTKKNKEEEQAQLVSSNIEWKYKIRGKQMVFAPKAKAEIEIAYSKDAPTVRVYLNEEHFILDLKAKTGRGVWTGDQITLTRKVKGAEEGIPLPKHWAKMPSADMTVYRVQLSKHSFEYRDVMRKFQATAGGVNIQKIERIQNPHLYQCYTVRKQKMDKDIGGNSERQLFHGTEAKNVSHINTQGFNRSFSGAHGVAFGRGMYFARDAKYSLGYAPVGVGGRQYMYLARVLVGQYCVGNTSMVVPPPKNPSRPEILYESVVDNQGNPSIFVVFYDNQCYPEYLITM